MPSIAAWTPTNWAAQVTGAQPGTHGLGGWTKHHKTDPMSVPAIQSWESKEWNAETVWQVWPQMQGPFLDHFQPKDIILVERKNEESVFTRPDTEKLKIWLEDYSLGDIWSRNIIEGTAGQ